MPTLSTCLWFDGQVLEAAEHYVTLVDDARVVEVQHYPEGVGFPGGVRPGDPMLVRLEILGQSIALLNGGPAFQQDEACSLVLLCEDQEQVDRCWEALTGDGGQESQCGWLKDRFGVSWQILSHEIDALLNDPDPQRRARATTAMFGMRKLDAAPLRAAADAAGGVVPGNAEDR